MNPVLQNNHYLVKEHVGMFKAANNYDIVNADSGQPLLNCREPNLGFFTKLFRFTDYKTMTPFEVVVTTADGAPVLTVRRGITLLRSEVEVFDHNNTLLGTFRQRLLSIGGKFDVLDPQGREVCQLQGHWASWDFKFLRGSTVVAQVTKKWAGLAKEMFTTADNYVLLIDESVAAADPVRPLVMAAVLCIDMVLKE